MARVKYQGDAGGEGEEEFGEIRRKNANIF